MQDYNLLEKIGSGSYGSVFKAFDVKKKEYRAIKKFKKKYKTIDACKKEVEVDVLTQLKHPNIIHLRKVIFEEGKLYLIMDLGEKNLGDLIEEHNQEHSPFAEEQIR